MPSWLNDALPFLFPSAEKELGEAYSGLEFPEIPGGIRFEDIPELQDAFMEAKARVRDPRVYEERVRILNQSLAPVIKQQYDQLARLKNKPSLYNQALQKMNQQTANIYRSELNKAFLEEKQASDQARGELVTLGTAKQAAARDLYGLQLKEFGFQADRELQLAQARIADKQQIADFFGDLLTEGAAQWIKGGF